MFASRLAPWLARRGVHYGWLMVALTFLTTVCSSAAISLSGILVLPLVQEFGWGRADIGAVMGLMLLLFAGTAPFGGAIMLRYGLDGELLDLSRREVNGRQIKNAVKSCRGLALSRNEPMRFEHVESVLAILEKFQNHLQSEKS